MNSQKELIYETIKNDYASGRFEFDINGFYKYVDNIFDDPLFIENSSEYLKNWQIKRGLTEEYRIPEDYLFGLFYNFFYKN